MSDLEPILLGVTAVAVASLTVLVLGLLRLVTDLRLTLSGHGDQAHGLRLTAGRLLPDVAGLEREGDALIVFVAPGCPACESLLAELDGVRGGRVVLAPLGELDPDPRLSMDVLQPSAAKALAEEMGVEQTPFVLAQRDGILTGHLSGESAAGAQQLQEFWATMGVMRTPQEVHP